MFEENLKYPSSIEKVNIINPYLQMMNKCKIPKYCIIQIREHSTLCAQSLMLQWQGGRLVQKRRPQVSKLPRTVCQDNLLTIPHRLFLTIDHRLVVQSHNILNDCSKCRFLGPILGIPTFKSGHSFCLRVTPWRLKERWTWYQSSGFNFCFCHLLGI